MAHTKKPASKVQKTRIYNARPDTLDFRDRLYQTSLVEVPIRTSLDAYRAIKVPVLDQGEEGACTGFALATVCHYLLRTREVEPDRKSVSPRMLYAMARRYDEWPGEDYDGASARGAMKGWHKHGVCKESLWKRKPDVKDSAMTAVRSEDAAARPVGAYFRVPHNDLVAMHAAQAEVGVLYATATVHTGWQDVKRNGIINYEKDVIGGHAFAIVAYDAEGFWIQNSWGRGWGKSGFGHISYDDWLENGSDVWVARLAVPVKVQQGAGLTRSSLAARQTTSYAHSDIRPHVISIGNDGCLCDSGTYGTSKQEVQTIITEDIPRISQDWPRKRILLYAHGGLVSGKSAVKRVADYRQQFLDAQVYPLTFSWKSDYWTTLKNMLKDAFSRRREEGLLDKTRDFMLDRLDDTLEPIARLLTGRAEWKEMKENALLATTGEAGGARYVAALLNDLLATDAGFELHIMAHSAGAVLQAPLVQLLGHDGPIPSGPMQGETGLGLKINTCTLLAPACTMKLFNETFLPAIHNGAIDRFALFSLKDGFEQDDDLANIYHKSLLYLVSNAFEDKARIPVVSPQGEPLLGMEKFIRKNRKLMQLIRNADNVDWILTPNDVSEGSRDASRARQHGDFDDDAHTVKAGLARILGKTTARAEFSFAHSPEFQRERRRELG
jgi:hypothetical protein